VAHASELVSRLDCAHRLVGSLAGERGRWEQRLGELFTTAAAATGDALLASAFVCYAGSLNTAARDALVNQRWVPSLGQVGLPCQAGASVVGLLASDNELEHWCEQGLPADQASKENAVIMRRARRYVAVAECAACWNCA